ncbi:MAG: sensor histidine kinase/response regulator, partial [Capsulimonas sp.]|nr:sensor histidine kinase/response regulator [Capsulimonas sp.]
MAIEKPTASKSVDPKVVEILDRLDLKTQDSSTFTISGAWRYRQPNMSLSIEHAAGGIARTACQARLLWRDGIALLSSSFSYAGSACTLLLVSNEGDLMSIRGAIEACRHVQGNYHELKIKFTHSIEPQMFIENNSKGENGNGVSHLDPSHLRANIVHLDDSEADARLLTHHLRDSGITLRSCRTPADALAALKDIEMADIFLCDLNLGNGKDSIPVIRDARSGGFTGPIVLLTAEHQPGKLESAKQAGVDVVLAKPFTREALMNVIVRLHHQVGAIAGDTLYSTMSEHPDVADLVGSYVTEMKGM